MSIDTRTRDLRFSIRPRGAYWRLGATAPYSTMLLGTDCPKNIGSVGTVTSVRGTKPKGLLRFRPNPCQMQKRTGEIQDVTPADAFEVSTASAVSIWNMRPLVCEWIASNYRYTLEGYPSAQVSNIMVTAQSSAWDNGLAALSVQRAYADMTAPSMQVLVDMIEFRQTIALLKSPLKFILDQVAVLGKKKKSPKRKKSTLSSAATKIKDLADSSSNAWLQYVYGWIPMAMNLEAVAEALYLSMMSLPSFRARARALSNICTTSETVTKQFGEFNLVFRIDTTEERKAVTTLHYKMDVRGWRRYTGTRVQDLPLLLWEIIPYSFVADWFIGIGDWINSCMADVGTLRSSSTTCTWTKRTVVTLLSARHITGKQVPCRLDSYTHESKTMERRVNEAMSKTPLLNERFFTLYRTLSSAALIWGAISKVFRKTKAIPPPRKKRVKPVPFGRAGQRKYY